MTAPGDLPPGSGWTGHDPAAPPATAPPAAPPAAAQTAAAPGAPVAGWYTDPYGRPGAARRWWDGVRWTDHVAYAAEWRDPRPLVPYVVTGLVLTGLAEVSQLVANLHRIRLAARLRVTPPGILLDSARNSDREVVVAGLLGLAAFLATAVLWIVWFNRVYHDTALFRRVRLPGMAVWGWLIPVYSYFAAPRMLNDAWTAGDPTQDVHGAPRRVPPLIALWTVCFICAGLVGGSLRIFATSGSDDRLARIDDLALGARFAIVSEVLLLIATPLAIAIVRTVTRRLHDRAVAEGRTGSASGYAA
jgi:hypothetical protein